MDWNRGYERNAGDITCTWLLLQKCMFIQLFGSEGSYMRVQKMQRGRGRSEHAIPRGYKHTRAKKNNELERAARVDEAIGESLPAQKSFVGK